MRINNLQVGKVRVILIMLKLVQCTTMGGVDNRPRKIGTLAPRPIRMRRGDLAQNFSEIRWRT